MGREELERKLKNWKFAITIDEAVAYLAKYFKLRLGTEVYALIATQKLDFGSIKEILSRHLSGEAEEERRAAAAEIERQKAALHGTQEKAAPQDALVIDDDISKIQYKLAKCCNPIKGDDVFGFVTISAGITIHRCDCPNAKRMRENYPYRVIDARWRQSAEGAFRVTIRIVAADGHGQPHHRGHRPRSQTGHPLDELRTRRERLRGGRSGRRSARYGRRGHAHTPDHAHQGRAARLPRQLIPQTTFYPHKR